MQPVVVSIFKTIRKRKLLRRNIDKKAVKSYNISVGKAI